jgi:hypothetical protein
MPLKQGARSAAAITEVWIGREGAAESYVADETGEGSKGKRRT